MAKRKVTKAVQKVNTTSLELFSQVDGDGFENVDSDSLSMSFLRIAQNGTPQTMEDDPAYVKGLKPGFFFNTVSGTVFGKELKVVVLGYYRMYVEWLKDRAGRGSVFTVDEFNKMKPDLTKEGYKYLTDEGNEVSDTRNFFIFLPDHPEEGILLLPLSSSGITHARKWLTKASMIVMPNGKKAPLFSRVWSIETALNKNDDGRWFQLGNKKSTLIHDTGFVAEKDVKQVLSALEVAKGYLQQVKNIDYTGGGAESEEVEDFD